MSTQERIDAPTLASRAGVAPARIEQLAGLGIVARGPDGNFATSDVASARLALAFEASGISLDDLGAATTGEQLPELASLILREPIGLRERSLAEAAQDLGLDLDFARSLLETVRCPRSSPMPRS